MINVHPKTRIRITIQASTLGSSKSSSLSELPAVGSSARCQDSRLCDNEGLARSKEIIGIRTESAHVLDTIPTSLSKKQAQEILQLEEIWGHNCGCGRTHTNNSQLSVTGKSPSPLVLSFPPQSPSSSSPTRLKSLC